jgi:signal transduction histidine kinase
LFSHAIPEIGLEIEKLKSGEEKLVKVQIDGRIRQLSINAKELVLKEIPYKLVSIKDIQAALENNELESWQKLIRVLTHEIKNSAIPISTLSEVVENIILQDGDLRDLVSIDPEEKADLKNGISIIGRRSRSLVEFVNAYGELARLPDPRPAHIPAAEIIETAAVLLDDTIKKHSIDIRINCSREMQLWADKTLIEQAIINITKNAIEALESSENGTIEITCDIEGDRPFIDIRDNGPGMDTATLDQIFIPFYSTKDKGSGIGLSLSRQIMRAHRGELLAFSVPGKGTRFRLKF